MASGADQGEGDRQRHRDRAASLSAYFDTSAFLKLLIVETGTDRVRAAWREAGARSASVALLAEARAGLAAANRAGRTTGVEHATAVVELSHLWSEIDGIDLTEGLAHRAGELADSFALRGYDAIHLASAEALLDEGDVLVVSDTRLAEAAASLGLEALIPAGR